MNPRVRERTSVEALIDRASLADITGRVGDICVQPLSNIGFSAAALEHVKIVTADGPSASFVLKHTRLDHDWTALRTDDRLGREALLLADAALMPVWDVFACPYVAFARGPGEIGLLLDDLSASLLPDVRAPLTADQEHALLTCLARLHARFWNPRTPAREWLARPSQFCDLLAPAVADDPGVLATLSPPLRRDLPHGWHEALSRVPFELKRRLTIPGIDWERRWADLPATLLHGDVKVANFALLQGGRIAAFDWAMAGTGPCTIDVGWYLAVNASRLSESKDLILRRYRSLLEADLGFSLGDPLWNRLEEVAIVCGARMLLWSKALALAADRSGARDEWDWWIARLETVPAV